MALTKCKECGNEISTDAKTCPHCGKQLKSESILTRKFGCCGCLFVIFLAIIVSYIIGIIGSGPRGGSAPSVSERRAAEEDTLAGVRETLAGNDGKWELISSYSAVRLVYLHPSELKNEKLIAAILYKLVRIDENDTRIIRIGFYDDREQTPKKLPMSDGEMLHWKAQYNLNKNSGLEEFFYNEVANHATSRPQIKHLAANIRPGLVD